MWIQTNKQITIMIGKALLIRFIFVISLSQVSNLNKVGNIPANSRVDAAVLSNPIHPTILYFNIFTYIVYMTVI